MDGRSRNEVRASHETPEGVTLRVVEGDLTRERVDAVVNAANGWLAHGGGVAGAILRRAGLDLQLESDAWVDRHGEIPDGGVAHTTAGMLPCKRVIHAVGPVWKGGNRGEEEALRRAVTNALSLAAELGHGDLAMPAISSGIFGFPKELCATVMLDAALAWCAKNPGSSLREVRFTNIDAPTVAVFLDAFRKRFGRAPATT